jgi:protein-L-isoaspartate(D-aspartate) O-methyltransferase
MRRSTCLALLLGGLTLMGCSTNGDDPTRTARHRMVEEQLAARGIHDRRVLDAMRVVPRHELVPESVRDDAYRDGAFPIGYGATISQPYIVGLMTEALGLEPGARVLEVGTGSGYQAAVLAELGARVFSIEYVPALAERAAADLARLGYDSVTVRAGDGYAGWPEEAPFDGIVVTAAPDHVPSALIEQLRVGGKLVIPVGDLSQELLLLTRTEEGHERESLVPVRFVPMQGEAEKR